jgi:integrase
VIAVFGEVQSVHGAEDHRVSLRPRCGGCRRARGEHGAVAAAGSFHHGPSPRTRGTRHACGFKLANDGHDTRSLQHYLGHKNIKHTVRYTEMAPDRFKGFWKD